jgi:uncharacterized protein YidB (DUF937 family)
MGLLDVLNGIQNGPRGQRDPSASSGGMSPITMAVLGLLAYKALKHFGGQPGANPASTGRAAAPPAPPLGNPNLGSPPVSNPNVGIPGRPGSGGLGDMLKGAFGGLLAGSAAGSVLSGGLNDLVKQFQQSGHGDVVNSWVGPGSNKTIAPNQLAEALGSDRINALAAHSGMSREELLDGLSQELPDVIDQLTPEGRVPTEQEAAHMV